MQPQDISQFEVRVPKLPGRALLGLLLAAVAALVLWNTWYTVAPEEVGVVLRFGRFVRQEAPGLHFKLPAPVERVYKVPVQRQLRENFGFRTGELARRMGRLGGQLEAESLMLTGDLNVAVVEWTTQYRVADAYKYLFKVADIQTTFRDMNEAVMRAVVGDRTVNEVLTVGRQEVADMAIQKLQALCDEYETGIVVDQIVLQDVNPPDPVKPSFNEVNQAQQEKEKLINDAMAAYNRAIPRARGEALRTVQQAEGYAADRVNRAKGDAKRFEAVLAAYRRAPNVTRRRLYLETMAEIFPRASRKVILDEKARNLLPLLSLDGEVKK
ncbi:FtsH protease activity modulator HflK [Dissulfurirhabdus thermomarina]|uniref:Protein HflK n=1 Tax=Dissulfurirhabdus thermomarina TaxID=1765737 RepID=A0A6N9TMY3_DISTH|nr:FtsH protease activity modulator HflK [Dissulfurirhabdus thermomarina]NDY42605.1 FtsH protease activity modulator HflK [Dissulfurirhabdus thermomarina]NMX22650.1 FtsH protease activity modulator HflK [Dissulfurirhabdus thermomarina]